MSDIEKNAARRSKIIPAARFDLLETFIIHLSENRKGDFRVFFKREDEFYGRNGLGRGRSGAKQSG